MTKNNLSKTESLTDSLCRDNFLNLNIFYKQLAVEEIIQHPAFELLSLFSEVGGSLGLLVGASVLSICEIIDFIIVTISTLCTAKKTSTKNVDVSQATSTSDVDVEMGAKGLRSKSAMLQKV